MACDTWHSAPNHMGHPPQRHVWGLWDAAIHVSVYQYRTANRTSWLILPLLGSHLIPNTSGRRTTSLVCFWKTTASSGDSQSTGTRQGMLSFLQSYCCIGSSGATRQRFTASLGSI
jgi:hypothetical protein